MHCIFWQTGSGYTCEKDCKLNNNKKVTPFSIWIPYLTKKQRKKYKWSAPETLGLWLLYNKNIWWYFLLETSQAWCKTIFYIEMSSKHHSLILYIYNTSVKSMCTLCLVYRGTLHFIFLNSGLCDDTQYTFLFLHFLYIFQVWVFFIYMYLWYSKRLKVIGTKMWHSSPSCKCKFDTLVIKI